MKKLIDQIMRFGIVGVLAFFIDYGVMVALTELFGVYYLLSACISFTVSVIFNYVCSMKFVFTRREDISLAREFVTFVLLSIIFATAVVMVWNFVSRKIWLEKKER